MKKNIVVGMVLASIILVALLFILKDDRNNWLPRDNTYHIKISHEDTMVEAEFSTYSNDITCITTMQLQ